MRCNICDLFRTPERRVNVESSTIALVINVHDGRGAKGVEEMYDSMKKIRSRTEINF